VGNRSPLAKLAIIIALTLALILVVLVCMWLFEPQEQARPPSQPEPAAAPASAASTPLAAPELEALTARASAADTPAAVVTTNATLIVICRAKETGQPFSGAEVYVDPLKPRHGKVPQPPGTHGQLGDMLTTAADGRVEFEIPPGIPTRLGLHPKRPGLCEGTNA